MSINSSKYIVGLKYKGELSTTTLLDIVDKTRSIYICNTSTKKYETVYSIIDSDIIHSKFNDIHHIYFPNLSSTNLNLSEYIYSNVYNLFNNPDNVSILDDYEFKLDKNRTDIVSDLGKHKKMKGTKLDKYIDTVYTNIHSSTTYDIDDNEKYIRGILTNELLLLKHNLSVIDSKDISNLSILNFNVIESYIQLLYRNRSSFNNTEHCNATVILMIVGEVLRRYWNISSNDIKIKYEELWIWCIDETLKIDDDSKNELLLKTRTNDIEELYSLDYFYDVGSDKYYTKHTLLYILLKINKDKYDEFLSNIYYYLLTSYFETYNDIYISMILYFSVRLKVFYNKESSMYMTYVIPSEELETRLNKATWIELDNASRFYNTMKLTISDDIRNRIKGYIKKDERVHNIELSKFVWSKQSSSLKVFSDISTFNNLSIFLSNHKISIKDRFESSMDIICFNNCAIDVTYGRTTHTRILLPEDYATKSCSKSLDLDIDVTEFMNEFRQKMCYDWNIYTKEWGYGEPTRQEKIELNDEYYKYVMRCLGYCLIGDPVENKTFFFKGEGGKGKTTLLNDILSPLGDYVSRINIKDVNMSKQSSEIGSKIAKAKYCRILRFDDLKRDVLIEPDVLKALTQGGRDCKLIIRDIKTKAEIIPLTFVPIFECNGNPKFNSQGQSYSELVRRVVVLPANSYLKKFTDDEWEEYNNLSIEDKVIQRKQPYLSKQDRISRQRRFRNMVPKFLVLCLNEYLRHGMVEEIGDTIEPTDRPLIVKQVAKEVWGYVDQITPFFIQEVKYVNNDSKMNVYNIYTKYKSWWKKCEGNGRNTCPITKESLIEYLKRMNRDSNSKLYERVEVDHTGIYVKGIQVSYTDSSLLDELKNIF